MGLELDWLNKHYFAGEKDGGGGNDGMLHRRRAIYSHFGPNIPPEWVDAWISDSVTHKTESFGIVFNPSTEAIKHCASLRVRVNEWMLGI